MNYTHKIYTSG